MDSMEIQQKVYELLGSFGDDVAKEHMDICADINKAIQKAPASINAPDLVYFILNEVDVKYISIITNMVQHSMSYTGSKDHEVDHDLVVFNQLSSYLIFKEEQETEAIGSSSVH